jgi:uncharacterized protein (TIGR00730 family)
MKSILVYCGANAGKNPIYKESAQKLGKKLAEKDIQLVYGGGSYGLMGIVADSVLDNGGYVIGIIPHFLDKLEVGHKHLQETYKVATMHERKAMMEEKCEGIITLAGGYGSMDELFEILSWAQLGLHQKPVGLLNTNGFYDNLIKHLDLMVEEGFLKPENRNLLLVSDDIDDLLEKMQNFKPSFHANWLSKEQI